MRPPHITEGWVEPVARRATAAERREAEVVHLGLAGVGCPSCANRIRNALMEVGGVLDAEVDPSGALATVWVGPEEVEVGLLLEAVVQAGKAPRLSYLAVPLRLGL